MGMTRTTTHEGLNGSSEGGFKEVELVEGATPASIELNLTAKGTYTWTIKEYFEVGTLATEQGRMTLLDNLLHMDALLHGRFKAAHA